MIRVLDLERSLAFYKHAFGLDESHRWEFATFTLLYLRDPQSGFELELTANKGQVEPYTHGTGYGHLAFCVPDLEAHRAKLLNMGCAVGEVKSLSGQNSSARFYFLTDPDGYKIEVLQRGGHYV